MVKIKKIESFSKCLNGKDRTNFINAIYQKDFEEAHNILGHALRATKHQKGDTHSMKNRDNPNHRYKVEQLHSMTYEYEEGLLSNSDKHAS